MISIRSIISLGVTKLVHKTLRLLGYHGSSMPGWIMEKLSPNFINEIIAKGDTKVIMVTGTNGKTTTTQIISSLLKGQHKKVISNISGSNFTRGITSTLIINSSLFGNISADFIVLEVDEAYTPILAKIFKPDVLVALNILRDQLDRYGEINKTAEYIGKAANHSKCVIVNGQDNLLVNITTKHKHKRLLFGAVTEIAININNESNLFEQKDEILENLKKYDALLTTYKNIKDCDLAQFSVQIKNEAINNLKWNIIGEHNALNAISAILAVKQFLPLLNEDQIAITLKDMKPPYGRAEDVLFKNHHLIFNLVKNPSGFNQTLNSYLGLSNIKTIVIFVNDEYADSRDVSWLWDVNFEKLKQNNYKIYLGGTRKYDIALCLKYQDIEYEVIDSETVYKQLNDVITKNTDDRIMILPTYTAMLNLRQHIAKHNGEKHIW